MKILGLLAVALSLTLGACGHADEDAAGTYVLDIADVRAKMSKQVDEKLAYMKGQLATVKSVAEAGRAAAEDKENWEPSPDVAEKLKQYEKQIADEERRSAEVLGGYEGESPLHAFELVLEPEGVFTSKSRTPQGELEARGSWTCACGQLTLVTSHEDGAELENPSSAALPYLDGVIELQREEDPFPVLLRRK